MDDVFIFARCFIESMTVTEKLATSPVITLEIGHSIEPVRLAGAEFNANVACSLAATM